MTAYREVVTLFCIFFVSFEAIQVTADWRHVDDAASTCASLFTNADYTGTKFQLKSDEATSSVSDLLTISSWNETRSLRVHAGCTLTLCGTEINAREATRSGDTCHNFSAGPNIPPIEAWNSESSVVRCRCEKVRFGTLGSGLKLEWNRN